MATSCGLVVSEVLCYMQCRFLKVAKNDIITTVSEFYTCDEVVLAKKVLFDVATSLKVDYIPSYTERKGANRLRASTEDLLALFTLLDANKARIPQFVAANPIRLPPMATAASSNESTVAALTTLVYELRDQVAALTANIDELRKQSVFTMLPTSQSSSQASAAHAEVPKSSWADQVAALRTTPAPFQVPARHGPSTSTTAAPKPIKVGKGQASSGVKGVPRPLVCFVGRLDSSTTAEGLHDYLEAAGIRDVHCRKLEAKNGRVFKTAAFRVSCSPDYRTLFYDESNWPEGAELRDWVFRPPNGAA